MKKCEEHFKIPSEIAGEDVYDMLYIFKNEKEAVDYVVKTYNLDSNKIVNELYEEESFRNEFGKESYLRHATVCSPDTFISELMSGEYILWIAY